jgi:hypothetical protein
VEGLTKAIAPRKVSTMNKIIDFSNHAKATSEIVKELKKKAVEVPLLDSPRTSWQC